MMTGYSAGLTRLDGKIIRECTRELQIHDPSDDRSPYEKLQAGNRTPVQKPIEHEDAKDAEITGKSSLLKIVALACILALFTGTTLSFLHTSKVEQSIKYARYEAEIASEQGLIGNKKKRSETVADPDRHPGEIIEKLPRSKRSKVAENNQSAAVDLHKLIKEKSVIKTNPVASDTVKSDPLSKQKSTGNRYLIFNKPETPLVRWTNYKSMSQAEQLPSELLERKFSVYFKPDSTEIASEDIETLAEIAGLISQDTNISVRVDGYTDSYGNRFYNQKLSQLRANMVKSYLVGHGINISRISAMGLGPANPIADNENEKGRSRNRRVEIKLQLRTEGSGGKDRQNE